MMRVRILGALCGLCFAETKTGYSKNKSQAHAPKENDHVPYDQQCVLKTGFPTLPGVCLLFAFDIDSDIFALFVGAWVKD